MSYYCDRCHEYAYYGRAYHVQTSPRHHPCQSCNIDFASPARLTAHFRESPAHDYCVSCDEHFDDEDDLLDHMREEHGHHWCEPCNRIFQGGALGLHEHRRQSHSDRYCVECRRVFMNGNNFRAHMNSSLHRTKDIRCPMHGCGLGFVSVAAMMLHLEQGACSSGMNRTTVNRLAVQYDRNNVITNPARLIAGPSGSVAPSVTTYAATDRAYNGRFWECYLCNNEFSRKAHLTQHLNSPRHQDKLYRCPRSDCAKEFTTLSGIMQHVESQSCEAYRFRGVQDVMDGLSNGLRRLAF